MQIICANVQFAVNATITSANNNNMLSFAPEIKHTELRTIHIYLYPLHITERDENLYFSHISIKIHTLLNTSVERIKVFACITAWRYKAVRNNFIFCCQVEDQTKEYGGLKCVNLHWKTTLKY